MNDIPNCSGIYKITCTANKKIYIGSAANLRVRQQNHWSDLRRNKHGNKHLQNAWNKYGEQTFIFDVLELVLPMSLTAREQYWLNKLEPFGDRGFNGNTIAGSTLGRKLSPEHIAKTRGFGRKHTPETLAKMRQAAIGRKHTPETKAKISQIQVGKKLSPETRKKLSQAHIGHETSSETREKIRQANLGYQHTPEAKEKMSHAKRGRKLVDGKFV